MLISRDWLSDFVDLEDVSSERFEELVTTRVAEVDERIEAGSPLRSAVVGYVEAVKPHPKKKKLTVASVNIGAETVQVVCGAANCVEGVSTAYIPPGASFRPKGGEESITVERRQFDGVESVGVLLSESELDVGPDNAGIIELQDVKPGDAVSRVLGDSDVVLEIDNKSLTHRPDLWCHFGFAREISAILGRPLKKDIDSWSDATVAGRELLESLGSAAKGKHQFAIEIAKGSDCRRFGSLYFEGVKTSASPLWMKRRLYTVGAGVRNILVDLSNYVMHDIGQPNHAYDAKLLSGGVIEARKAREGEVFRGLDEVERELSVQDTVIADGSGVVALAGVMGGQATSVQDDTSELLLESANFDPVAVRLTTKRHALRTDASNRFEKSRSAYSVPVAIHRFSELLLELVPGSSIAGPYAESFAERPKSISIPSSFSYIRSRLGAEVPDARISEILGNLGFGFEEKAGKNDDAFSVSVPFYRATKDIAIEDDLVEEVGRTFGYENIPEEAPQILSRASRELPSGALAGKLRELLRGMGFSEVYNYSFMSEELAKKLGLELESVIEVENAVDSTKGLIRSSLVPGMIGALEKNAKLFSEIYLFELGKTYERKLSKNGHKDSGRGTLVDEDEKIALLYSSGRKEERLEGTLQPPLATGADFYAAFSAAQRLVSLVSKSRCQMVSIAEEAVASWMHPFRAAEILLGGETIGLISEISPGVIADIKRRAVLVELSLPRLLAKTGEVEEFSQIARFPDSFFEVSVVLPAHTPYAELEQLLVSGVDPSVLRRMEVLSVYQGEPLAENEKSISVKLFLGAPDRTLSGEELGSIQQVLMEKVDASPFSLRA